ncbi:MAG: twitching motility protein PilT [Marivirga sp.]|nr:twitching motility protein PilT [Marivirga sp.]
MRIFLDANILVSVLNKEYPLFTYSSRVVSLLDNRKFEVYTSPICLAIAFYFSEKKSGSALAKRKMELLISKIRIASVDEAMVSRAIKSKSIADFEDGLEYYSALAARCQCIITEDVGDFFFSDIEVIQSLPFLEKYVIK